MIIQSIKRVYYFQNIFNSFTATYENKRKYKNSKCNFKFPLVLEMVYQKFWGNIN